jgi:ubiquinone/menaquinone biosynthesis C-methylase UbiE
LAINNPSYLENIEIVRQVVARIGLPDHPRVCDLGGGTGNYICALAEDLSESTFVHVDADPEMNSVASAKFERLGLSNVEMVQGSVFDVSFAPTSFDLILCVNALYSMNPQSEVLARVRQWLKPGGFFLVIDFGRRTKVLDWGRFILGNMIKTKGVLASVKFVWQGIETLKQNQRGSRSQAEGIYWLHSTEEFGAALTEAGFVVEDLRTCYRGYCDLALCRRN